MFKKIMLLIACIYSGCVMSMSPPYSPLVWDALPTTTPEIYHTLTTDLKTSQACIEGLRKTFLQTVWEYKKDKILQDIGDYLDLKADKADPFESPQNYCLIVEYIQTGALDFSAFAEEIMPREEYLVPIASLFFREMPYAHPKRPVRIPKVNHIANAYVSYAYRQFQNFEDTLNMLHTKISVSDMPMKIEILDILGSIVPAIIPTIKPAVETALLADLEMKRALKVMQTLGVDSVISIPKEFRKHILLGGTVFEIDIETNKYVVNKQIMQEWIDWTLF